MLRIIRRNEVPPNGYKFLEISTKTWIEAPTMPDWHKRIKSHRESNGIPLGDIATESEDQLCQSMPPGVCEHVGSGGVQAYGAGTTSFGAILAGTRTLFDWWVRGREKVTMDEAESRASVCANCPCNQPITGCAACNSEDLRGLITQFVGGEKTTKDDYLHACTVCGCGLKAKIWLPLGLLKGHMSKEVQAAFPAWCWMSK